MVEGCKDGKKQSKLDANATDPKRVAFRRRSPILHIGENKRSLCGLSGVATSTLGLLSNCPECAIVGQKLIDARKVKV